MVRAAAGCVPVRYRSCRGGRCASPGANARPATAAAATAVTPPPTNVSLQATLALSSARTAIARTPHGGASVASRSASPRFHRNRGEANEAVGVDALFFTGVTTRGELEAIAAATAVPNILGGPIEDMADWLGFPWPATRADCGSGTYMGRLPPRPRQCSARLRRCAKAQGLRS
jgi:hypothetical protein